MGKILIADGTEGFRNQLRNMLAISHTVVCAADGVQAWEMFLQLRPDLVVVDLELPEMDGMTLLKQIDAAGFHPAMIVLARLISDFAVDTLVQMKVEYLLRKPCKAQNVAERTLELLRYRMLDESPVQAVIMDILRECAIPANLDGSKYLLSAILLMAQNPTQYITKELYPSVGKPNGKDGVLVERCIRNAIEKGWMNGDPSVWECLFGKDKNGLPVKPKNGIFINKMVELLKTKL